jgi:hypothetical protein
MSIQLDRVRIGLAIVLSLAWGWLISHVLGVPAHAGFEASVLHQPSAVMGVIGVAVAMAGGTAIALPLVRRVHEEAALAIGVLAAAVLSFRGGTIYYTLVGTGVGSRGASVYLTLALETVVLFGLAVGLWMLVKKLSPGRGVMAIDEATNEKLREDEDAIEPEPLDQKVLAVLIQAVVMAAVMMFLCRSTEKLQVLLCVLVAGLLGSMAAHRSIAASPAVWFWMGPLVVGLIGYVSAYFAPTRIEIGDPGHYFAALARPLPIDYLAAGVPGAIWGYAMRRRGQLLKAQQARAEARGEGSIADPSASSPDGRGMSSDEKIIRRAN